MYINEEELDLSDDALTILYNGQPFTGVGYEKDDNGQIIGEISYVNGQMEGPARSYFASGRLQSEEQYHIGSYHGLCRYWYENGQLEAEKTYEHAILTSSRAWDSNGNLTGEYQLTEADPMYEILLISRQRHSQVL
jgi:antitoxin component YwqK of YwqJK toxin-antitoxin module